MLTRETRGGRVARQWRGAICLGIICINSELFVSLISVYSIFGHIMRNSDEGRDSRRGMSAKRSQ